MLHLTDPTQIVDPVTRDPVPTSLQTVVMRWWQGFRWRWSTVVRRTTAAVISCVRTDQTDRSARAITAIYSPRTRPPAEVRL